MISHFQFLRKLKSIEKVNLLGLDIGTVFIGIAVSKDSFGIRTIEPVGRVNIKKCEYVQEIEKFAVGSHGIVVGLSDYKDSGHNKDFVNRSVNELSKSIALPFVAVNEDYTSVQAADILYNIYPRYGKSKYLNDQVAACLILEKFIKFAKSDLLRIPNLPDR